MESKVSNAWKTSKDKKQRRREQVEGLEGKIKGARTQNKALEKKIGKMDAEIYELKTDLQSMIVRLRIKDCQINFIQLVTTVHCVTVHIQKKITGTNTDSSSRKVSNAMVVCQTGTVWHPPGHLNHVETKQQSKNIRQKRRNHRQVIVHSLPGGHLFKKFAFTNLGSNNNPVPEGTTYQQSLHHMFLVMVAH